MRSLSFRPHGSCSPRLRRYVLFGPALILLVGAGSWGAQRGIRRRLSQSQERDRRALCEAFANAPVPRIPEVGLISPYPSVRGSVDLRESVSHDHAATEFTQPESGVIISVSIHACHPWAVNGPSPVEFNVVDGSAADQCTSGGTVVIRRPDSTDQFSISFKLLGAPPGFIQWDARQFVEQRDGGLTWEQTLHDLQSELRPLLDHMPESSGQGAVRSSGGDLVTVDPRNGSRRLMEGPREEMRRLFDFRAAFREFYRHQDADHARRVAGLIVDSLLASQRQRDLSDDWRRELLDEADAAR